MRSFLVIALCGCTGSASTPPPPENQPPHVAPVATSTLVPRGQIAASWHDTCAIEATGKVACWGLGGAGRTGTPDELDHLTPIEVPGLADVAGLAGGTEFMCAWTARGEVSCWGGDVSDNRAGDHRPRVVPHVGNIVQIVAGLFGACGLHANGRVVCWPEAAWTDPLWPPAEDVAGLDGVVEIAGDDMHLCARLKSGEVTCKYAPDNHTEARFAIVPELTGATSLTGSSDHFAALLPGPRLAFWDIADFEGRTSNARQVHWIGGVAGDRVVMGEGHQVCVLGSNARCWKTSDLAPPTDAVVTLARPLPAGVRDLSSGFEASCARIGDRVQCWGMYGRLGDGVGEWPTEFVAVKGVTSAEQLESKYAYLCALHAGRVACWGGRPALHTPQITDYEPVELPGVTDAVELAMSSSFVCARRKQGATCWSFGGNGGPVETRDAPELASAVKLYSGPEVCGVSANGAVACTKNPLKGWHPPDLEKQLHAALAAGKPPCATDGTSNECFRATGARLDSEVTFDADYALSSDGTVTARSHQGRNQISQGVPPTPEPAAAKLTGVVELRAGANIGCARRADGTVACWGNRDYLGAGQRTTRNDPVTVANLEMGQPRQVAAPPPAPDAIAHATGAPIELASRPMLGPYKTGKAACEAQACPDHAHERQGEYCTDLAAQYDPQELMASPPAPFSEVRLITFDCRNPDNTPDSLRRLRMMVTRPDGVWLSAPLVVSGVNGHQEECGGIEAARWEVRAVATKQDVVLSLVAGSSCHDAKGGNVDEVSTIIVAGNAAKPFTFAPIVTGVSQAHGCTPGLSGCTPSDTTVKLATAFAKDGLVLDGGASWPAVRRDKTGAVEGLARGKTEAAAVGTYKFKAP